MNLLFSGTNLLLIFLFSAPLSAQEADCLQCHGDLAQGKSVHAAVAMGCSLCHTGVDARDIPHRITNKNSKGLSAPPLISVSTAMIKRCPEKRRFTVLLEWGVLYAILPTPPILQNY